jgi:hypothetical protein
MPVSAAVARARGERGAAGVVLPYEKRSSLIDAMMRARDFQEAAA